MKPDEQKTSKFLSYVLRHKPDSIGLELDSAGWVEIDLLLAASAKDGNPISFDQLRSVVENNDKKRFEISGDGRMIRASQGHSLAVDLGYEPKVPPEILYHGTASRFVESIRKDGLHKRARHHVHLSASKDTASDVGARYGKLVLLSILAAQMHNDGYVFYLSTNMVWLTDNVPAKYIRFPD